MTSTYRPPTASRPRPLTTLVPLALLVSLALAACGSSTTATTPSQSQDTKSNANTAENGTASGEAAAQPYTNAKFNYRIDAPGTMKEAADGSAAYLGAAERLEITVVSGSSAADPKARATADISALSSAKTSFKLVQPVAQANIAGKNVEKFIYTWTDGTNPVTGKPNVLVSVQYYIPKNSSTLAAVTYSIAASQYDPQGADDIASTFRWL